MKLLSWIMILWSIIFSVESFIIKDPFGIVLNLIGLFFAIFSMKYVKEKE